MLKWMLQYFSHLMWRANLLEKTLMRGNTECRRRWGTTEDEMVALHYRINVHEFEQTPGDGEGQGSLACCSPQGHKESDTTEWLKNSNNKGQRLQRMFILNILLPNSSRWGIPVFPYMSRSVSPSSIVNLFLTYWWTGMRSSNWPGSQYLCESESNFRYQNLIVVTTVAYKSAQPCGIK